MPNKKLFLIVGLTLCLGLVATACKKRDATIVPSSEPTTVETPPPAEEARPDVEVNEGFQEQQPEQAPVETDAAALNERGVLKTIYFDYDKSELTETARATLKQNADWLKTNAQWNVVVEGHTDERGTLEYNLALGQRRAASVREYMGSLGIAAERVRVVSYGEERPAEPTHNEAAYAKNRRAVSLVEDR